MRSYGFTLLELLISLLVIAILLGVGIPSFSAQIQHTRLEAATSALLESLSFTRSQAITSNNRTTMRKLSDWQDGWEIFIDTNNDGQLNTNEQVLQRHEKLTGVTITSNLAKDYVSYVGTGESRNANGTVGAGGFQAGTLIICPTERGEGVKLILARGGRVKQEKAAAADCASI